MMATVDRDGVVYDETAVEERRERELVESGAYADMPTRSQISHAQDSHEQLEAFRFTIADNPGLIEDALDNVGLGDSFLRSMERSHALVYVRGSFRPGAVGRAPQAPGRAGEVQMWDEQTCTVGHRKQGGPPR